MKYLVIIFAVFLIWGTVAFGTIELPYSSDLYIEPEVIDLVNKVDIELFVEKIPFEFEPVEPFMWDKAIQAEQEVDTYV